MILLRSTIALGGGFTAIQRKERPAKSAGRAATEIIGGAGAGVKIRSGRPQRGASGAGWARIGQVGDK